METYAISAIVGLTPTIITQTEDRLIFTFTDGRMFKFWHGQDCCETVEIDDVNGDWSDLIGNPLLVADERVNDNNPERYESSTWTFYTFRSINGSVDVKWVGESNGYYSEHVDYGFINP